MKTILFQKNFEEGRIYAETCEFCRTHFTYEKEDLVMKETAIICPNCGNTILPSATFASAKDLVTLHEIQKENE